MTAVDEEMAALDSAAAGHTTTAQTSTGKATQLIWQAAIQAGEALESPLDGICQIAEFLAAGVESASRAAPRTRLGEQLRKNAAAYADHRKEKLPAQYLSEYFTAGPHTANYTAMRALSLGSNTDKLVFLQQILLLSTRHIHAFLRGSTAATKE
ncbi:hypothetical protein [Streptomyces sp. NPDC058644]|uniref:hypothetical protein n=1 Tax=unclassified Streptomyces TaxID=2593676 RepID=UPI0036643107